MSSQDLRVPPANRRPRTWRTRCTHPRALSLSLVLLAACGGSGLDDNDVTVRETSHPSSATRLPRTSFDWFVYFAEEALDGPSGTDLNGDGDVADTVAFAVRTGSTREEPTGVAARDAVVVRSDVWLVVDEAEDGVDWDLSGTADDLVLLHFEASDGSVAFLETLDEDSLVVEADDRVYYASASPPGGGDETNLRYVERGDPRVPVVIENEETAGPLTLTIFAERDELLLLALDETENGLDLNGDGDMADETVLGLLEAEDRGAVVTNIGLAVEDEDVPFDAGRFGDEWLLGILVSEADEGRNLNDPAAFPFPLAPDSCVAADADQADQVLHFLRFPDFREEENSGNTGIAGRDRVIVVRDHVATLSDEADAGGCDLNEDGDTSDAIVRWARAEGMGGLVRDEPERDPSRLVAVDTTVPGDAFGLAGLGSRLVALIDEGADGRDYDGRAGDAVLVAWIDPDDTADPEDRVWQVAHQSSNRSHGTAIFASDGASEPYASASWMASRVREGRLGIAFEESVPGANPLVGSLNNNSGDCTVIVKDTDVTDALPVWLDFEDGPTLDFDGLGFATVPDNAGLVVAQGFAHFRVSELDDNRDWNGDGVLDDVVLVRNPVLSCDPQILGVTTNAPGPAILTLLFSNSAAFLSTGVDFDGDGMATELVVRHFAF